MEDTKRIEQKLYEIERDIYKTYGEDDLSASILALLYYEEEELTMEEIADMTGYSLSSISLKMKELMPLWGIKRKKKPGSRKTYFSLEKSYLASFEDYWKRTLETEQKIVNQELLPLIEEYSEIATSDKQLRKLNQLKEYVFEVKLLHKQTDSFYRKFAEMRDEAREYKKRNKGE